MIIELLARRSRFIFWGTVPLGAVLLGMATWWKGHWNPVIAGLDVTFLLYAAGIYDPKRFSWALRGFFAIVFLLFFWMAVDEFLSENPGRKNYWNILHGLIVFGIPAGLFALRGRSKRKARHATLDPYAPPPPIEPE
jgi:hypothetical protein